MISRNLTHTLTAAAVLVAATGVAQGQTCNYGEPATGYCHAPYVIPGTTGQHVVLMDCAAATNTGTIGNIPVGNVVYFDFVPDASGSVTISTCHPNTLYDTVIGLYRRIELCEFQYLTHNDDATGAYCEPRCTGSTSELVWNVQAGVTYTIMVGSYLSNPQGCPLCLGLIVTLGVPCGEPPRNFVCGAARPLSGTPGEQLLTYDTTDAIGSGESWTCGNAVGKTLWFQMIPQVRGTLRVTSCAPGTDYDTVARVLAAPTGCSGAMVEMACADDDPVCVHNGWASSLETEVDAGQTYYVEVGGYNGTAGCLEVRFHLAEWIDPCLSDTQPPVARLDLADFECRPLGVPMQINGAASDPDNNFGTWVLEERAMQASSWTPLTSGTAPFSGDFYHWQPAAAGYRMLRLTATDACGHANTATRLVYVDTGPQVVINSPANGAIVGGSACIDGLVSHGVCGLSWLVERRPVGGGWTPLASGNAPVLNLMLASWNTLAVPDGNYQLRVSATSPGGTASQTVSVTVDNTSPIALLSEPFNCKNVRGVEPIHGTALDANFDSWALQYSGGDANNWITIASGTTPVNNALLANWDTSALPPCTYVVRLVVTDRAVLNCGAAVHQSEYVTTVVKGLAGNPGDMNCDGLVNFFDIDPFVNCLFTLDCDCP